MQKSDFLKSIGVLLNEKKTIQKGKIQYQKYWNKVPEFWFCCFMAHWFCHAQVNSGSAKKQGKQHKIIFRDSPFPPDGFQLIRPH
jgi:hypothetical protein